LVAEDAAPVRKGERHNHEIAALDRADIGPDHIDDADRLMSHAAAGLRELFQSPVRPQITATDTGACDSDNSVGRLNETSVGNILDPNVPGAKHDSCTHDKLPLLSRSLS
jgi:hypothetical protein